MGHLLSSAIQMQPAGLAQIEYSFELGSTGTMTISYNGDSTMLNNTTALTTETLIPSAQIIQVTVTDTAPGPIPAPFSQIIYSINSTYITTYSGTSSASTPSITTSAGNTYIFYGQNGNIN